jgi:hypothetical protein
MVALAPTVTVAAGTCTRMSTPRAAATVLAAAHRRAHVGGGVGPAAVAFPEHLADELVELVDLPHEEIQQVHGVQTLTTERGDCLAGHPQRRHPPPQLM